MLRALLHRAFLLLFLWSGLAFAGEAEWRAHMQAGEAAQKRGDSAVASASFDAALREAEGFGPQDRRLAITLSWVAANHQAQGRLAESENHFRRALAIREATDGPDHFEVSRVLNSIAANYLRQHRLAEAEPLLLRAISIAEKTVGPDQQGLAMGLHNLGNLKQEQGKYAEAEPLFQRALAVREKARGQEHPLLVAHLDSLASLYFKIGNLDQAELFAARLLALREKLLGPDHVDVAKSLNQLADVRRAQGRSDNAEPLYLRALQILKSKPSSVAQTDAATVQVKLDELRRMQGPSADAPAPERQAAKPSAQEEPERVAAAARIWERARYELTIQTAKQTLERGETVEAERLCFLAITYVGARTVRVLEEYAALLATLNRAGAQDAKERAAKLNDQRLRREPGSVHLGFEPAGELVAYARLLRELARTAEADAVVALADAERQVSFINFIRNVLLARGDDPRGICSVDGTTSNRIR